MSDETESAAERFRAAQHLDMTLTAAFDASVAAAQHLDDPRFMSAIIGARKLARKIDAWDVIVEWAHEDVEDEGEGRPRVPQNDNVSISAFQKACESLGLTPTGAKALDLARYGRQAPTTPEQDGGTADASSDQAPTRVSSIEERRARSGRPA